MTTYRAVHDSTTSSSVVNASDVTTAAAHNVTELSEGGCGEDGTACNVTQTPVDLALCTRLAPPPVPPWLRDSPSRLHELTRHCRSWTLYNELCNSGTANSTWGYPRHGETSDGEVWEAGPPGVQWVIPALALVVVLLLLLLALVLYKYYSRPDKKRMYRVSGAGYRFKPPQGVGGSWAGGPLVESETAESYLSQPGPEGAGPDFRYTRSPVCRLLEQTQYVATPTEDQHRPRPSGPPAFASPAYFLPALSWLRLPILRQSWPGQSNGVTGDSASHYNAAIPVQCDCGETTTHHWPEPSRAGDRDHDHDHDDHDDPDRDRDDDPQYSEIWDGPPQYSSLSPTSNHAAANGIGPYEYEMQERANGHPVCECHPSHPGQPHGHRPRVVDRFTGSEHRYEKLWQCGREGAGTPRRLTPEERCSSTPGTCENGWLSRYRLPSPCIPATDPARRRERGPGHAHLTERGPSHAHLTERGPSHAHLTERGPGHAHLTERGVRGDDPAPVPDARLLPCECSAGEPLTVVPSDWDFVSEPEMRANGRTEVKYANPVYEGRGAELAPPRHGSSPPLLSRLWGYIGWNRR